MQAPRSSCLRFARPQSARRRGPGAPPGARRQHSVLLQFRPEARRGAGALCSTPRARSPTAARARGSESRSLKALRSRPRASSARARPRTPRRACARMPRLARRRRRVPRARGSALRRAACGVPRARRSGPALLVAGVTCPGRHVRAAPRAAAAPGARAVPAAGRLRGASGAGRGGRFRNRPRWPRPSRLSLCSCRHRWASTAPSRRASGR